MTIEDRIAIFSISISIDLADPGKGPARRWLTEEGQRCGKLKSMITLKKSLYFKEIEQGTIMHSNFIL